MSKEEGFFLLASPRLARYFSEYASYHRTPGNKWTHYFGITFILTSLLGLLGRLPIGFEGIFGLTYFRLDGGTFLIGCLFICYSILDWKIAIPFIFILLGFYFFGRALPIYFDWVLFCTGWILQGIGHSVYEQNLPAFFNNLTHLFIGPLWIFARVIRYR